MKMDEERLMKERNNEGGRKTKVFDQKLQVQGAMT
jgi:hypothetical protein